MFLKSAQSGLRRRVTGMAAFKPMAMGEATGTPGGGTANGTAAVLTGRLTI
jgi:hypothetical protein